MMILQKYESEAKKARIVLADIQVVQSKEKGPLTYQCLDIITSTFLDIRSFLSEPWNAI